MIKDDLSNAEYHATDAVSSSDVKKVLMESVWHWHHATYKSSPAMDFGTAVHDIRLEDGKNIVCGPATRRGNAWKDAEELAKKEGKLLLTEGDYNDAYECSKALLEDPVCAKQLNAEEGMKEHSIFVTCPVTKLKLKARPDIYNPKDKVMSDLKCTVDPSPAGFLRQIYKFRYDAQAFFYSYVAMLAKLEVRHFCFLAVSNKPPYKAHMHNMSMEAMKLAENDVMRALKQIAEAKKTNTYETGWDRFTMIHPPKWMEERHDFEQGE